LGPELRQARFAVAPFPVVGSDRPGGERIIITRRILVLGASALAACGAEGDLVSGEAGRITRVTDGDTLGLDAGLRVRLAEVEAPAPGYDGREDQPFAAEARSLLVAAAMGRQAKLWYGGLMRDTYERALAHVIVGDETGAGVWLNGYAVRQGGAWVRTWPDNMKRARRLLAFEEEARKEKRGLWGVDHWRVRGLDELEGAPPFSIIEGPLAAVEEGEGWAQLSRDGIRLAVSTGLGRRDIDVRAGSAVRVRGRIDMRNGLPKIRVTHWPQVEAV
jgi:endonuclease YncB( thermonuclease family)